MSFDPPPPKPPRPPAPPGPSGVMLLVVMAILVVGGYALAMKLKEMGRIQDCAMSGRTNCAPIESGR